ncbi:hypothetical protein T440DRAFT_527807 [Plenodomus tracheiphilus IPT5]|uniref:Uncharacterized protein n=1 Tax=Plenodomus tracheiphilus IPT5 TaxID=1408161 RepID=A0A6A7B986_9PLEO|nr:hypothetical protein T440DRAFT_527807 [Plenodomus tracheiphilus IPT5]
MLIDRKHFRASAVTGADMHDHVFFGLKSSSAGSALMGDTRADAVATNKLGGVAALEGGDVYGRDVSVERSRGIPLILIFRGRGPKIIFARTVCLAVIITIDPRVMSFALVGTFPVLGTSSDAARSMMGFGITERCHNRAIKDQPQLQGLRERLLRDAESEKRFIMSLGVPSSPHRANVKGYWHEERNDQDCTIDLRIYMPCFDDRVWDEIQLFPKDALRMAGGVSQICRLRRPIVRRECIEKAELGHTSEELPVPVRQPLALRIGIFVVGFV